jgi:transcriptional regulator with XRE-family HTH domain
MDMAEVIRRRRAELGLSQADLAKAAGVDTRQIRRYSSALAGQPTRPDLPGPHTPAPGGRLATVL